MARIKAKLRSDGSALVTLPTGEAARIWRDATDRNRWRWHLGSGEVAGDRYSQEGAFQAASYASARRTMKPTPVDGFTVFDAIRIERECWNVKGRTVYTKALKSLLAQSTGHRGFSVRGGTGTAWSWISANGTDEKGRLWIAALFPDFHGAGLSVPPTPGYRAQALALAAGIDATGIKLREHSWEGN